MGLENLDITQAVLVTVFTGVGAALLKLIETIIVNRNKSEESKEERFFRESKELRVELRGEIKDLEKMVSKLNKELDEWRAKYWDLYQKYVSVVALIDKYKDLLEDNHGEAKDVN